MAQNEQGMKITGVLKADGRASALKALSEKHLIVTRLTTVRTAHSILGILLNRVKGEEILLFTQELGALLGAGINMLHSMEVIGNDVENPQLKAIIHEIESDLSSGRQLSSSLKKFPEHFSRLYVSLIEAGETSGNLSTILTRLAVYLENAEHMRKKVQAALIYPAVVLSFAFLVVTMIFVFGIPRLRSIYSGLNVELPIFTKILIGTGNFLSHNILALVLIAIAAVFVLTRLARTVKGQIVVDNIKLNLPLLGPLFQKLAIARFSSTMSTLYASGVPILNAFSVVAGAIGNRVLERAVLNALTNIREGHSIVEPLRRSGVFTSLSISMIAAGEESGTLDRMLNKIADFYETQVEISIKGLTGVLEPIILIIVGLFIAIIILSIALPFMTLGTLIK